MLKWLISLNRLLVASSLLELMAGTAMLCAPRQAVFQLTGVSLEEAAISTMTRFAGAGLFALGIACWLSCKEVPGPAPMIPAMAIYNLAAVGILVWTALGEGLNGVLLWPGVAIHSLMFVWCVYHLRRATN
jgi:hypothetical protein